MADRRMDNGRSETRPGGAEVSAHGTDMSRRSPEVSPPGSRERAESDVSGYHPSRDEDPALRQGRFHRAALMRLAQPRTSAEVAAGMGMSTGMGMGGMGLGAGLDADRSRRPSTPRGPYGEDDRDDRYATGFGPQPRQGDQETPHSLELRRDPGAESYRQWDRTGYGGPPSGTGQYDPLLGMGHASPGQPGRGVNLGSPTPFMARSPDVSVMGVTPPGLSTRGQRRWQHEPLTAREIMTRNIKTARSESPLREVADVMKQEDCGVVPIVDEQGTLLGLVTDRDLVIRAFTGGKSPDQLRARDVMTDDVECVHPEETIHSIIELMGQRQIRRIPVVDREDRLLGIISMGDIAQRADYDDELQEALDRISSKRSFWSRLR